jgi:hypothetical protein
MDPSANLASPHEPEGLKVKQRESPSFNQIMITPDLELRSCAAVGSIEMIIQFMVVRHRKVNPLTGFAIGNSELKVNHCTCQKTNKSG